MVGLYPYNELDFGSYSECLVTTPTHTHTHTHTLFLSLTAVSAHDVSVRGRTRDDMGTKRQMMLPSDVMLEASPSSLVGTVIVVPVPSLLSPSPPPPPPWLR